MRIRPSAIPNSPVLFGIKKAKLIKKNSEEAAVLKVSKRARKAEKQAAKEAEEQRLAL